VYIGFFYCQWAIWRGLLIGRYHGEQISCMFVSLIGSLLRVYRSLLGVYWYHREQTTCMCFSLIGSLWVYIVLFWVYIVLFWVYIGLFRVYTGLFFCWWVIFRGRSICRHDKDSLLGVYGLFRVYIGFFWVYTGLFYGSLVIFRCRPICRYDNEQVRCGLNCVKGSLFGSLLGVCRSRLWFVGNLSS